MATHDLFKKLHAEMAEDGYMLSYLPANQAYMVTFGSYDGPRLKGPAPLRVILDWYQELCDREDAAQEPCYD